MARYEQGIRLLAHCYGLLDGAEQTVALLTGVDDAGNPMTAPFDATATTGREPTPTRSNLAQKPASDGDDDALPF